MLNGTLRHATTLGALLLASCTPYAGERIDAQQFGADAPYVIYLHGRIVEDEGIEAVSPRHGPYRFTQILDRFEAEGFTTIAPVRGPAADPSRGADEAVAIVRLLIGDGVPASQITVIGASKGAYIASLVSHRIDAADVNFVILAGCSQQVVDSMLNDRIDFHGRVLAIRDSIDTRFAGSCRRAVDASLDITAFQEIVVDTGLEHGLIYAPHDEWVLPSIVWARQQSTSR